MPIMGVEGHDGFAIPSRIVLAREQPFRLGVLQVEPVTRQIRSGDRRETLEPRVMQVLIALARAGGEAVTRDDLIEWCWSGRIVSDDSINRVLSRIRRIASDVGAGSFAVETIPRVGYRLLAQPDGSDFAPPPPSALPRRQLLLGAGAAVGVAALGFGAWSIFPRAHEPLPLAKLYYERGVEARGQGSLEYGEQAVAYFRQATQVDPQYADAWGALAWGYRSLLEYRPREDSENVEMLARSAAKRALELDEGNVDARAALLLLNPFYRNWVPIERGCREILARSPEHNITRYNLAHVLTETGRWRESIPFLQELAAREPFWALARMQLFRALFNAGRLDEAEQEIQRSLQLWPRRLGIWSTRIRHLLVTERPNDALTFLEDEATQPPNGAEFVELDRAIVRAYGSGSPALRRDAVDRLLKDAQKSSHEVVLSAVDCSLLGEVDTAFSLIEGFFFGRGAWARGRGERPSTAFLFNSLTASLRRDPRFDPLVADIGLERFWRDTGTQPDYRRFA